MLFAFIYLLLQKRQVLSESKGEALFSARISSLLLFLSVVSFLVRPSASLTHTIHLTSRRRSKKELQPDTFVSGSLLSVLVFVCVPLLFPACGAALERVASSRPVSCCLSS